MLATIRRWIAWLQSKEPAWFQKNSWVNEAGSFFVVTLVVGWRLGSMTAALLVLNAANYAYERWLDPHKDEPGHNPIDDIGQRAAGSLLAAWLWSLL